ncbi:unnamed protein product [Pleuronectes platessa]|uniref:Uncharacterized protein n=1 Tax=Pleuronectes platessa TaxID=8262 RepID=A0A9N7YJ30_PLEPL|nr:unnamed protein product [Pleuronectes platessa]
MERQWLMSAESRGDGVENPLGREFPAFSSETQLRIGPAVCRLLAAGRAAERRRRFISYFLNVFPLVPPPACGLLARPPVARPLSGYWICSLTLTFYPASHRSECDCWSPLSCRSESCLPVVGGPGSGSGLAPPLTTPPPSNVCTYWIPLFTVHSDKGICQADEQSELKRCVMHAWKDLTSCGGRADAGWRRGGESDDHRTLTED